MSVVNNNLLLTADAGVSQYQVSRSLRFNTPDSAYANRTFGTPTTQGTFTFAMWVKRAALGTAQSLFGVSTNHSFGFTTGNALNLTFGGTSALTTTAVFRDTSAWYHIVWTQSGTSHTVYVNGTSQGTATATSSVFNTAVAHQVGANNTANYFSGYLAEVHFIDGQALTPSSFTETNATTGQLVPKAYTGTYGTNGFRLNFSDNSAATLYTLGADSRTDGALNGNNGTLVNGPSFDSANGGSLVFNSSNDKVTIPMNSSFVYGTSPFTIDAWIYVTGYGGIYNTGAIWTQTVSGSNYFFVHYYSPGVLAFNYGSGGGTAVATPTSAIQLNTWTHVCFTRVGTGSNQFFIYVNGVQQAVSTVSYDFNNTTYVPTIGEYTHSNQVPFLGRISNLKVYNNKGLTASEVLQNYNALVGRFGGTSTGSIVTDGMVLNLDAGNTASYPGTGTTWTDISLRKNNWTPNNLSVTAGAGNDSLTDTPTSYGTDTGAGGEVRGNYATLNPVDSAITLTNGNLDVVGSGGRAVTRSTIGINSGKWYWECRINSLPGGYAYLGIDVLNGKSGIIDYLGGNQGNKGFGVEYNSSGGGVGLYCNYWGSTYQGVTPGSITAGTTIGFAFDADLGNFTMYYNGVSQGIVFENLTQANIAAPLTPAFAIYSGSSINISCNFGQRPFAYAAPSGFKALCDTNLPTPTIAKGSSVFDARLYTGNNGTQSITGLEFSPDLVWVKARSSAYSHVLHDVIRGTGTGKHLYSSSTVAEGFEPANNNFVSFDANGFTLGATSSVNGMNASGNTFVAWAWDAGSTTVTNTAGTISSQVRANASAGFSIVTATSNGANPFTVGHGLGVTPAMYIFKNRDLVDDWYTWHQSLSSNTSSILRLNTTASEASSALVWGSGATSTTIGLRATSVALNGQKIVLYCFAPVTGYSSFGSYTGNGSADGPFVYLGFRPAFLMMKRTNTTGNWVMLDGKREGYNVDNDPLYANLTNVEGTDDSADITSNGFKLRTTNADCNASGGNYIYAAFAENPFQYARAR